jgi:tetratricopeptide (TPR) repeat protein
MPLSDLYFNRGSLYLYIQEYEKAYQNYLKAKELDPTMPIPEIEKLEHQNSLIFNLITAKANIKHKQIESICKSILPDLKVNQGAREFKSMRIQDAAEGLQDGCFIICKVIKVISDVESPVRFAYEGVHGHRRRWAAFPAVDI